MTDIDSSAAEKERELRRPRATVTRPVRSANSPSKSRSQTQMVLRRFLRHRLAMISLVVLLILVLFSLVGGRLWKYSYTEITDSFNTPPFRALDENGELVWSAEHPMGTDDRGPRLHGAHPAGSPEVGADHAPGGLPVHGDRHRLRGRSPDTTAGGSTG